MLKTAQWIVCEDTRVTGKLLALSGISPPPLESLHGQNEASKTPSLVERICASPGHVCLVSDAGTPGVSDPGSQLVAATRQRGIPVLSVPGPCSVAAALAACGFRAPQAIFLGFLQRQRGKRLESLRRLASSGPCVGVILEAPLRVSQLLAEIADVWGNGVTVCVSREISKQFEEHRVGAAGELLQGEAVWRGECVVTIEVPEPVASQLPGMELARALARLRAEGSLGSLGALAKALAPLAGLSAKELYNQALQDGTV